jgi:protein TonB
MPKEFIKSLCWALGLHGVLLGVLLFFWPFLAQSVFSFDQQGRVIKVSLVSPEWSSPSFFAKTQKNNSAGRSEIQKNPQPRTGSVRPVPGPIPAVDSPTRSGEDQGERKESGPGISFSPLLDQNESAVRGNGNGGQLPPGGNGKEALVSISSVKSLGSGPTGPTLAIPRYGLNPEPYYPAAAREKGWQGTALLKVLVLRNGSVGSLEILRSSGYTLLDRSALKAVKDWKFVPAQKDGQPIEIGVEIPVTFRLE